MITQFFILLFLIGLIVWLLRGLKGDIIKLINVIKEFGGVNRGK